MQLLHGSSAFSGSSYGPANNHFSINRSYKFIQSEKTEYTMPNTLNAPFRSPFEPGLPAPAGADISVAGSRASYQQAVAMGAAFGALFSALGRMFSRLQSAVNEARNKGDLVSLSDRALADLGIRRDDIPAIIAIGGLGNGIGSAVGRYLSAGRLAPVQLVQ
jgi:uncharacterized protein YjiS (DUF1127 family)